MTKDFNSWTSTSDTSSSSDGGELKMNVPSTFFCNPMTSLGGINPRLQRKALLKPLNDQFENGNFNLLLKDERKPVLYKLRRKYNTWKYTQWPY